MDQKSASQICIRLAILKIACLIMAQSLLSGVLNLNTIGQFHRYRRTLCTLIMGYLWIEYEIKIKIQY